jgi:serine/threonine protein kinase
MFVGRYEILAPLGAGGMGHVYRARHTALDREVALKVLARTPGDQSATRFEREARSIARLDHPSCVRILDYGRTRRHHFLVMQLLEGPTLAQELAKGPLAPARAVRVAKNLLSALAHAHARGVLHRDLKPSNIVLTGAGERAVLIDFGLAHATGDAPLTVQGTCLGSPSYLAPERLGGAPHDERADVYAVGVVLYEMLAGARPFTGETLEEILDSVRRRPARPLRAILPGLSRPLEAIVVRALAKNPARRFASAQEMLEELEDLHAIEAREAVDASAALPGEQAATLLDLRPVPPSWWARLWGHLRFGRWRWRHSA